jgi:hypothetical protein
LGNFKKDMSFNLPFKFLSLGTKPLFVVKLEDIRISSGFETNDS